MGWCSGTDIFDSVLSQFLNIPSETSRKPPIHADVSAEVCHRIVTALVDAMEDHDWDCQQDSAYYEHPIVQEVMRDLHPDWFTDKEVQDND